MLRRASPMAQAIKNLLQCRSQEDPLEKGMASHSCILAWKIPWTEEPGRLHTVHGVARIRHNLVTKPPQKLCLVKIFNGKKY